MRVCVMQLESSGLWGGCEEVEILEFERDYGRAVFPQNQMFGFSYIRSFAC